MTSGSFRGTTTAGSAPPGWEPSPSVENALYYFIAECSRVATASFERPLLLVIESHQRFRAPEACREGLPGLPYMVSAVWVSDANVSQTWAERFGLPAATARIGRSDATSAGVPGATWTWSAGGGPESRVETFAGGSQPTQLDGGGRLFWQHARTGGIAWSDLVWSLQTHQDRNPVQVGEMHPPTLWSQGFTTRYAGLGDLFAASQLQADYRAFEDLGCSQPAS